MVQNGDIVSIPGSDIVSILGENPEEVLYRVVLHKGRTTRAGVHELQLVLQLFCRVAQTTTPWEFQNADGMCVVCVCRGGGGGCLRVCVCVCALYY